MLVCVVWNCIALCLLRLTRPYYPNRLQILFSWKVCMCDTVYRSMIDLTHRSHRLQRHYHRDRIREDVFWELEESLLISSYVFFSVTEAFIIVITLLRVTFLLMCSLVPAGSFSELMPILFNVFFGLPQALSSFQMIIICSYILFARYRYLCFSRLSLTFSFWWISRCWNGCSTCAFAHSWETRVRSLTPKTSGSEEGKAGGLQLAFSCLFLHRNHGNSLRNGKCKTQKRTSWLRLFWGKWSGRLNVDGSTLHFFLFFLIFCRLLPFISALWEEAFPFLQFGFLSE